MKGVDGGSNGRAALGRPRLGLMDGVKVAFFCNRGMTVEAARKIGKSGEWHM